jgi:hypothetical protein
MLMEKKCDQSGMRNHVEGQVNRKSKTAPSILFAMMDQYVDEDTDLEEEVVASSLGEEHDDEDGSDIEAQVNWNIANERDPDFFEMSMRRIFDRERQTFLSSGLYF